MSNDDESNNIRLGFKLILQESGYVNFLFAISYSYECVYISENILKQ